MKSIEEKLKELKGELIGLPSSTTKEYVLQKAKDVGLEAKDVNINGNKVTVNVDLEVLWEQ